MLHVAASPYNNQSSDDQDIVSYEVLVIEK